MNKKDSRIQGSEGSRVDSSPVLPSQERVSMRLYPSSLWMLSSTRQKDAEDDNILAEQRSIGEQYPFGCGIDIVNTLHK